MSSNEDAVVVVVVVVLRNSELLALYTCRTFCCLVGPRFPAFPCLSLFFATHHKHIATGPEERRREGDRPHVGHKPECNRPCERYSRIFHHARNGSGVKGDVVGEKNGRSHEQKTNVTWRTFRRHTCVRSTFLSGPCKNCWGVKTPSSTATEGSSCP